MERGSWIEIHVRFLELYAHIANSRDLYHAQLTSVEVIRMIYSSARLRFSNSFIIKLPSALTLSFLR